MIGQREDFCILHNSSLYGLKALAHQVCFLYALFNSIIRQKMLCSGCTGCSGTLHTVGQVLTTMLNDANNSRRGK